MNMTTTCTFVHVRNPSKVPRTVGDIPDGFFTATAVGTFFPGLRCLFFKSHGGIVCMSETLRAAPIDSPWLAQSARFWYADRKLSKACYDYNTLVIQEYKAVADIDIRVTVVDM